MKRRTESRSNPFRSISAEEAEQSWFSTRIRGGPWGPGAYEDDFAIVPGDIATEVGLFGPHRAPRGGRRAKADTLLLSYFLYRASWALDRFPRSGPLKIQYDDGELVELEPGEFIASVEGAARSAVERYLLPPPPAPLNRSPLYERFVQAAKRLRKSRLPLIHRVRYARPKRRGVGGTVYTFAGTPLAGTPARPQRLPAPAAVITSPLALPPEADVPIGEVAAGELAPGRAHPVDLAGEILAAEFDAVAPFTMCRFKPRKEAPPVERPYRDTVRELALKGSDRPGHVGVGVYRPSDRSLPPSERPYWCPYLTLDIDEQPLMMGQYYAARARDKLVALGCPREALLICYTGGRGWHVHVPSGLFGDPIFRNARQGKIVLSHLASIADVPADPNLFSPAVTVRAIGTVHEDTGLYKVVVDDRELEDEYAAHPRSLGETHRPIELPDPRSYAPVDRLVSLLREGAEGAREKVSTARPRTASPLAPTAEPHRAHEGDARPAFPPALRRAIGGIAEGEAWNETFSGRNSAAFNVATYALERLRWSEEGVWHFLLEVNARNTPPMSKRELRSAFDSAIRRTSR